jgi:hypothetical protein
VSAQGENVDHKLTGGTDAVVHFSVAAILLTAWAWPIWRLIWTHDIAPGLVGLLAAVWLLPGCLLLGRLLGIAPRRWVYALTPLAGLVGMLLGGFLLALAADALHAAALLKPALGLWLGCLLAWSIVRAAQRRPGGLRFFILALVAVGALAAVFGLAAHDHAAAGRALGFAAGWSLAPGAASTAAALLLIAVWVSRRRSEGALSRDQASPPDPEACPTSAST